MSKIEKLYAVAVSSMGLPPPKKALFGKKCPKCGGKLTSGSAKELIMVGDQGTEFANKVGRENSLEMGVYELSVDHFACKCGYEFAEADAVSAAEDED